MSGIPKPLYVRSQLPKLVRWGASDRRRMASDGYPGDLNQKVGEVSGRRIASDRICLFPIAFFGSILNKCGFKHILGEGPGEGNLWHQSRSNTSPHTCIFFIVKSGENHG